MSIPLIGCTRRTASKVRPEDKIISETVAKVHVVDDRQDQQDKDTTQGFTIPLINPDTADQGEKNKAQVHKLI